ncbi:sugar phosphate isomerase/epimerase [Candidatus Pseudothioglobus singularis]|nr:sugar phosphate isomerase/epimerase [Candidatus Pseudothioglobus singularis]
MKKSVRFGMVQGRLTQSPPNCLQWFPQESWEEEFNTAAKIGVNYIELIAETVHNPSNPIWSDTGLERIQELVVSNDLSLHALCNDFIIENSLLDDKVIEQNINLINQIKNLNLQKYVLPLFESSELNSKNMNQYIEPLRIVASSAFEKGMLTCLETILTGKELIDLLNLIDLPYVKVVYDTGNRVAFGHDLAGDIRLLGDSIAHVHIKDKNSDNVNVLLGTGLVNFESVFFALNDINYSGPYTFETTRGSNPINTAKYNMNLVNFFKDNSENA